MSDKAKYNRIQKALRLAGVFSRSELLTRYDKGTNFTNIKGIGKVLGKILRQAVEEWTAPEWVAKFPMLFWGHPNEV